MTRREDFVSVFYDLREKYDTFLYRDYSIERTDSEYRVIYRFEIPGLSTFSPEWRFPVGREVEPEVLNSLVFQLGMAETISYYKCACPRVLKVCCGFLSKEQLDFWRKLTYNGLGEFLYRNEITVSEEELLTIVCEPSGSRPSPVDHLPSEGCLVPVGGGKDSSVTLELLKEEAVTTFTINRNQTEQNVIDLCEEKQGDYVATRILSPELLELNRQGYLNGHTPFSSIVAFSSYLAAYLSGRRYITLSNETSANETTVANSFVNHQYSKSFEFEQDFMRYIRGVVVSDITYFSLLRPLTELQIAALFSHCVKYHKVFRSCNVGSKSGIWCCHCPKCLFVYIILLPYLSEERLTGIFGENLLCKATLDEDFRRLTGLLPDKPFECVGTRKEVLASLKEYLRRGGKALLPERYRGFIEASKPEVSDMLSEWVDDNNVPNHFLSIVKRGVEQWISFRSLTENEF